MFVLIQINLLKDSIMETYMAILCLKIIVKPIELKSQIILMLKNQSGTEMLQYQTLDSIMAIILSFHQSKEIQMLMIRVHLVSMKSLTAKVHLH